MLDPLLCKAYNKLPMKHGKNESTRNLHMATVVAALVLAAGIIGGAFVMTEIPREVMPAVHETVTLTKSDRLLVVSPHPDDESIACSGLIQHALKADAQVRILWMTAGDHNIVGPVVFWRKLALTPAQYRDIGHRRIQEARAAASVLGVPQNDLIFLGYPDLGLSDIFLTRWTSRPYRSGVTNATAVPYAESVVHGQSQTATNLLADVEHVISSFQPTVIAYPNLIDNHPDHQTTGLVVTAALEDLKVHPRRLEYAVHVNGWPRPLRYAPFADAYAPPGARLLNLHQEYVQLTPAEVGVKTRAIQAHASELLPVATLIAFARRSEVFFAPPDLTNKVDPIQLARFFFPPNRLRDENRPVVRQCMVVRTTDSIALVFELGHILGKLDNFEVSIFPLRGMEKFASLPKLRISYRGGSSSATVTDLLHPSAKPMTIPVAHNKATISLALEDAMMGGHPQSLFMRIESGPSDIDLTRSRTIWVRMTDTQ